MRDLASLGSTKTSRMTYLEQVDALLRLLEPLSKMHGQPVRQFGHMHCVTCSPGLLQRKGRAVVTRTLVNSNQALVSNTALRRMTRLRGRLQRIVRLLVTRSAFQQQTDTAHQNLFALCDPLGRLSALVRRSHSRQLTRITYRRCPAALRTAQTRFTAPLFSVASWVLLVRALLTNPWSPCAGFPAPHLACSQQEAGGVTVVVSHQVKDSKVLSSLSFDSWVHLAAVHHQTPRLALHLQGLNRPPAQAGNLHQSLLICDGDDDALRPGGTMMRSGLVLELQYRPPAKTDQ